MSGSSGRILGTIAGAALAYFTGGASYVALGATLGGAVGSLLDPKAQTEGPRLDDLKVQFSSHGVGIPRIYGTERVGGNVIWSTDKLEIASVTSAGKGGGGAENTSYKYYVHMSMMLCETPRDGSTVSIVKFFQDGKLIWDASSGIPVGSALASAENPYSAFELFQGHEDQLPDPIEESWTGGPGTCSAYRGVVRIRMIAIECPGGRVPQFSFVLSTGATVGSEQLLIQSVTELGPGGTVRVGGLVTSEGALHMVHVPGLPPKLNVFDVGAGYANPLPSITLPYGTFDYYPRPVNGTTSFAIKPYTGGGLINLALIDLREGVVTSLASITSALTVGHQGGAAYDASTGKYAVLLNSSTAGDTPLVINDDSTTAFYDPITGNGCALAFHLGELYCICGSGASPLLIKYDSDGHITSSVSIPPMPSSAWNLDSCALQVTDAGVYALMGNSIGGDASLFKQTASGWDLLSSGLPAGVNPPVAVSFFTDDQRAMNGPVLDKTYYMTRFNAIETNTYKVNDIIAAECELAGVMAYDVSGIPDSDTVIGYKLANPASARANIEPLLNLIGGYVVDEDGVTKFKKFSDITSVADVSFDELGQSEGAEAGEAMPLSRTQEIDLPRSVTTSYIEPTNDYQTAAETEIRQVTDATEDVQIQLPICVTSDQARKVSQMALYDRWLRQNARTASVSRKFAFVSPGDGVTIEYPRGTFKLWLVLSTNDTGAVCEWSLCAGDAEIFTQTATGATGYVSQDVAPLAAPTRAQILDMPITRDEDNNAGIYVALDSYAAVPADAELYVGNDDATLESRGTVSASAPIGFAETSLPAATSGAVDEKNLLTVNIGDDVFVSCTRDVLLAGGGEYWAYGAPGRWEIGASAQGDSLGSGRYTLSRHLRGLFGTEQHTGTHAEGDTFVLLRIVGMLRPSMGVGELGQIKQYRAVTRGRSLNSAASQPYANTGEGLMPLSPVNLRRTDTNDFTVDRRSRLAMNNSTGTLPLGETTEAYSWAFYSSGAYTTLLATILTTTSTVTAAQMTAAGITPSATAFVKVRQISDSVGAGHELQATA